MDPTTPSRTAARVAVHRAKHQLLDQPKVFDDPLAFAVLDAKTCDEIRRAAADSDDIGSRALRAFVTVRSRHAEDQLAHAVERGVRQYVLLGAVFDTFAYRNPHPNLRVFEVDHPATQASKRAVLHGSGVTVPPSVRFAPVDFERESFTDGLRRAGFEPSAPAFFSWLGVTPYLEPATTRRTLGLIGSLPGGSGVTFDYALERDLLSAAEQAGLDILAARVAAAGEPFRGFFRPDALADALRTSGFSRLEDLDRSALNERYFRSRSDGLSLRGSAHLMTAWV